MQSIRASLALAMVAGAFSFSSVPASADVRNWSGLYVGGHAGLGNADMRAADVLEPVGGFFTPLGPAAGHGFSIDADGFLGGVQAGLQRQIGNFVIGAEISYSGTTLKNEIVSPFFPGSDRERLEVSSLLLGTARLGVLSGGWLWYLKGGYAGGDVDFTAQDNVALVTYKQGAWHNGWTIGAGAEVALSKTFSLAVEYNYADLGTVTRSGLATDGGPERYAIDAEVHAVTARINYLFDHGHRHAPMK